jgi:hypothetical protein
VRGGVLLGGGGHTHDGPAARDRAEQQQRLQRPPIAELAAVEEEAAV